jgi:hypothetical protein
MDKMNKSTVGYLWFVIHGTFSLLAPRKAIKMATMGWRAGFENVDELEPREWYVRMTRALGVGMLAAGIAGLLFEKAGESEESGPEGTEEAGIASDEEDVSESFEEDG